MQRKYLVVIGGATATGKTKVAIQLAQFFGTSIISCDSRQFYKEMNIGTAKPNAQELASAKHYFINSLSIIEEYNVGKFEQDALTLLKELHQHNQVVIMVGGSGLFIRAVCEGLDDFPTIPEEINIALQKDLKEQGLEYLQQELFEKDPVYFSESDIQNPRRILRALGIIRTTNQAFSSYRTQTKKTRSFLPIYIKLSMDREVLYERINRRVDLMINDDLVGEAKRLYNQRHLKSLQTVGYQELFEYFDGTIDLDTAIEHIKRNSRRYAKRQETWFRKDKHWTAFHFSEINKIQNFISSAIRGSN